MREQAELTVLDGLLRHSAVLLAARVDASGTIVWANAALDARVPGVVGAPAVELVTPAQRGTLAAAIEAATGSWTALPLALDDPDGRTAEDRTVLLRREPETVLLVAEPALASRDGLVEQVLELNEDLISTQRGLSRRQRQLERAQAETTAAADRVRRLEAIMLAGLTRPTLTGVLEALLEIAQDVIGADRSALLLRDEDRRHLQVAAARGVPAATGARLPIGRGFAGMIAATGRPQLVSVVQDPDGYSMYLGDEVGSVAGIPLVLEKETIGVLYVGSHERGRFAADDLTLLERIGERAALAIGHAQLRDRERAVVEALQRSLLPDALPDIDALGLCGRYLPRAASVDVGGDFYDAVCLDDGRVCLSIGDVAGKGIDAAATTGRLRNALHAVAFEADDPATVLDRLDRLVVEDEESMATAIHLVLDPATGELVYANAGHPPPLRIRPDGAVEWLEGALAPPLGTGWSARASATSRLEPGDRLLLYTDGLVERRTSTLDEGMGALAEAAGTGRRELAELCEDVVDELSGAAGGFEDDVAVLAAEFRGGGRDRAA